MSTPTGKPVTRDTAGDPVRAGRRPPFTVPTRPGLLGSFYFSTSTIGAPSAALRTDSQPFLAEAFDA